MVVHLHHLRPPSLAPMKISDKNTLFFAHLEFNMVHCGLTAENTSEMCANGHAKNASPKILIYQCYTIYFFEIKSHIINV